MSMIKEDESFQRKYDQNKQLQMQRTRNILRNKILSNAAAIQKNQYVPIQPRKRLKSFLTFHEYKGPSEKYQVTKVPLKLTSNKNPSKIQLIHEVNHSTETKIQYTHHDVYPSHIDWLTTTDFTQYLNEFNSELTYTSMN